ncbi:MAG: hypothetical protein AB7S26_22265 [Sandaracinaceae bacterium]
MLAAAVIAAGCGGDPGPLDGSADGEVAIDPIDLDTVAPMTARAGQPLALSCVLIEATGEEFAPPADLDVSYRFVPEDSAIVLEDGSWAATQVGRLEVACVVLSERLTDATPAIIEVTPGDPAYVVTRLDLDSVEAGELVDVGCDVYDAYGNRVEGLDPSVRAEPADDANTFTGLTGRFERAGSFDLHCEVPGAVSRPAQLEVRPGLPDSLVLARVPYQEVYARGQVIDIERIIADQFGNRIPDARAPTTATPAGGQQLGDGRWRFANDGRYTITATVEGPTHSGMPLSRSTIVVVDGNGPAISCDDPLNGAILDRAPGGLVTFHGSVDDVSGISSVRVNGTMVPVNAVGLFQADIPTVYGINFVDLAAVDGTGREASRTCAFLLADVWAPADRALSDTLSMRLRQDAFDDGNRSDGLDSLTDVLHTVLNSTGLRDQLHTTLSASPDLKPSGCDSRVLGVCVLRSHVRYENLEIQGPNTVSLTLVPGGLAGVVRVENLRVRIRVDGHVAGIPYDTTGWVTFRSVEVHATFDTALSGGRPRITVRPGSVSTSVGSISTSFGGLDGAIINIVVSLFNGTVRNLVAGLVRDWVTGSLNGTLDGLVSSLDVTSLGTSFDVPRLDSAETIPLTFGVGFSSLDSTTTRMLFGIGTRIYTPAAAHARPTLGAPVRRGSRLADPSGTAATSVAVHEAILNQALHALWRGGFFDANLDSSTISGVPAGVSAEMTTALPPVAVIKGERVVLSLGAMSLRLAYPGLFATPIDMTLGVRASMTGTLTGDDLVFGGFSIDELYFSTDSVGLDMASRDTVESFLRRLLERVIGPALNDALPAIPIPSFTLPASLAPYGLPAGARLGITSPTLTFEEPHVILRGGFAVR